MPPVLWYGASFATKRARGPPLLNLSALAWVMGRTRFLFLLLLVVLPMASCGGGYSSPPPVIMVTVMAASPTVSPGATDQFMATVTGTTNMAVTWQVNNIPGGNTTVGTITTGGLYTAPGTIPNPAMVTVKAISAADGSTSGSTMVTVAQQVPVIVSPNSANVTVFGTQPFSATVGGVPSTAVTWQVNNVTGGAQATGYISSTGKFVAPGGVPTSSSGGNVNPAPVTVTAVSTANPNSSGSATVTIVPGGQNSQTGAISLGTSGGNQNYSNAGFCCSGTLGSLVTRASTQYILSNNHVLACTDGGVGGTQCPKASGTTPGSNILQPGLADNNCQTNGTNVVATLTDFYNFEATPAPPLPKIDAAIAQVVSGAVDPNGKILYLGSTTDTNGVPVPDAPNAGSGVAATMNMSVAKSGRTTGLTCSTVIATSINTSVQYQRGCNTGSPFIVTYSNQIDVGNTTDSNGTFTFGGPGDSGSLIVTQATADPVALLFAGSDIDTIGNPVADVLNFFKSGSNTVTFVGGTAHQVIGCTLPMKPASVIAAVPTATASAEALQKATAVRDAHAPELLAHPEVQAAGIGASYDNPHEPAILLFVTKGQPRTNLPATVDGIRTRIIEGDLFGHRGALSAADSTALEQSAAPPQLVYSISDSELARAQTVHSAHVDEWMNQPGVQGFGISSSVDSPGEAALMIFLIRGAAHQPIPPLIDGVRTRLRESSRFRAGVGDAAHPQRPCSVPTSKGTLLKPVSRLAAKP